MLLLPWLPWTSYLEHKNAHITRVTAEVGDVAAINEPQRKKERLSKEVIMEGF
jgi:hypothetical protein